MQRFPTTLFHKELAPEGQVFMNEDSLPTAKGWVDTPAAFDPAYKPPPPPDVAPGTVPADAPAGFVPQPFPSLRYKVGDPDHPKTVLTAEEDAALEAAEPGVWKHSPDPNAKGPAAPGPDAAPLAPNALSDLGGSVTLTDAQKAEFYAAKVADVVVKLEAIGSPALLTAIGEAEEANPKGARVTVVKAVKARLAALSVPA